LRGSGAVLKFGAAMPINVRLRASSGVLACVGTAMPINVRLRLRSGMAGA